MALEQLNIYMNTKLKKTKQISSEHHALSVTHKTRKALEETLMAKGLQGS